MPERAALDAVVFDAGGTLVRLDFEWMADAIGAKDGAQGAEALRRAEIAGRRRYDASVGPAVRMEQRNPPLGANGDIREYFFGMLEAAGVKPDVREAVYQRFRERQSGQGLWSRPVEGARA